MAAGDQRVSTTAPPPAGPPAASPGTSCSGGRIRSSCSPRPRATATSCGSRCRARPFSSPTPRTSSTCCRTTIRTTARDGCSIASSPYWGESLLTADGDTWRQQRRRVQPSFKRDHTAGFAPIVTAHAPRCWRAGRRSPRRAESCALYNEMTQLALVIIGDVLFGVDLWADAAEMARAAQIGAGGAEEARRGAGAAAALGAD